MIEPINASDVLGSGDEKSSTDMMLQLFGTVFEKLNEVIEVINTLETDPEEEEGEKI